MTEMKAAVVGAGGQLGSDLVKAFDAVPLSHQDVDVTDPDSLDILRDIMPDLVINAAAYVRVDDAEEQAEEAFRVNAVGALNVARACDKVGAINVYISTDYVLDLEPSFGVYHLVNEGYCSWFDFSRRIFDILGEDVRMTPIKSDDLGKRARRPAFSGLKNQKLRDLGLEMRGWEDALVDYLAR